MLVMHKLYILTDYVSNLTTTKYVFTIVNKESKKSLTFKLNLLFSMGVLKMFKPRNKRRTSPKCVSNSSYLHS